MYTKTWKWPGLTAWAWACGALTLTACGASAGSPSTEGSETAQVGSVEAALENPVIKCQQDQASCVGSAKDANGFMTCNGTFRSCLDDAAKAGQEAAKAVQDCRDQARDCVTKGGASAAMSCRTDYETCVQGAMGTMGTMGTGPTGAGPTLPNFPQLPAAGRRAPRLPIGGGLAFPNPGGPRLPGAGAGAPRLPPRFPFAGAPAFPGLAGRGAEPPRRPVPPAEQCFADLRECVRMPGSNFEKCAMTARECLRSPGQGAAGSGETGGTGGM